MTLIIAEGRTIAAKLDDSGPNELLTFHVDNPNTVDTIQCAMHMMRTPPSSCGRKVGQLLAYAAIKTQDSKVFTQLLKTMKKPIDAYLLGAFEYITTGPSSSSGAASGPAGGKVAAASAGAGGKKSKKDDVLEELRSDIVDVMSSALSQNGQLVVRDDQHLLQAVYINALKTFPKNKKKLEMLENALAKFGNVTMPKIETPELPPAAPLAVAAPAAAQSKPARLEAPKPAEDAGVSSSPVAASAPASVSNHEPPVPLVPKRESPPSPAPAKRVIGVSKVPPNFCAAHPRPYTPIEAPTLPDVAILGGLFGLASGKGRICGAASALAAAQAAPDLSAPFSALAVGATAASSSNGFVQLFGPMDAASGNAFGATADRQLLEGVMRAWGQ